MGDLVKGFMSFDADNNAAIDVFELETILKSLVHGVESTKPTAQSRIMKRLEDMVKFQIILAKHLNLKIEDIHDDAVFERITRSISVNKEKRRASLRRSLSIKPKVDREMKRARRLSLVTE